jgi:hypothetical protein
MRVKAADTGGGGVVRRPVSKGVDTGQGSTGAVGPMVVVAIGTALVMVAYGPGATTGDLATALAGALGHGVRSSIEKRPRCDGDIAVRYPRSSVTSDQCQST